MLGTLDLEEHASSFYIWTFFPISNSRSLSILFMYFSGGHYRFFALYFNQQLSSYRQVGWTVITKSKSIFVEYNYSWFNVNVSFDLSVQFSYKVSLWVVLGNLIFCNKNIQFKKLRDEKQLWCDKFNKSQSHLLLNKLQTLINFNFIANQGKMRSYRLADVDSSSRRGDHSGRNLPLHGSQRARPSPQWPRLQDRRRSLFYNGR